MDSKKPVFRLYVDGRDPNVEYEIFNCNTYPKRLIYYQGENFECSKQKQPVKSPWAFIQVIICRTQEPPKGNYEYVLKNDPEDGSYIGEVVQYHSNSNIVNQDNTIVKEYYLNDPCKSWIGFCIRMYRYGQGIDGWRRVGDMCFTKQEMLQLGTSITKPIFSRAFILALSREGVVGYHGETLVTLDPLKKIQQEAGPTSVFEGHDIEKLEMIQAISSKEHGLLKQIGAANCATRKVSPTSNRDQYLCPMFFFCAGLFPTKQLPLMTIDDWTNNSKRFCGYGFSGQSLFYCQPILQPAATENWFRVRLNEVLKTRGIASISEFLGLVEHATTKASEYHDEAFQECLKIVSHVLRMHVMSRPYVNDYGIFKNRLFPTDEDTLGIAIPGDCEDTTKAIYFIYMTLLLRGDWITPEIRALRKCAAMLGVPCAVTGTFQQVHLPNHPASSGHWYLVAMPWLVFTLALTGDTQHFRSTMSMFKQTFGFNYPQFHTKCAILDGILISSLFYGLHGTVSNTKKQAFQVVRNWLIEQRQSTKKEVWDRHGFTCIFPLTYKEYHAEGHAYRLFTDIFDHLPSWKLPVEYVDPNTPSSDHRARSFMITGNFVPSQINQIIHDCFGRDEDVKPTLYGVEPGRVGVPINVIACGKPYLEDGFEEIPLFRLFGLVPFEKQLVDTEKFVRLAIERPIVPLDESFKDCFRYRGEDEEKHHEYDEEASLPPRDSNHRMTLFAYPPGNTHGLEKLLTKLNAKQYWTFPYASSTCIVIHI